MNKDTYTISLKGNHAERQAVGQIQDATTILVVGAQCYGYGVTIAEAKANAKRENRTAKKFFAYLGDDSIGVNAMGMVEANKILIELGEV